MDRWCGVGVATGGKGGDRGSAIHHLTDSQPLSSFVRGCIAAVKLFALMVAATTKWLGGLRCAELQELGDAVRVRWCLQAQGLAMRAPRGGKVTGYRLHSSTHEASHGLAGLCSGA